MLKARNPFPQTAASRQRGSSLIEVLVAVLLVSVALVGMAALQAQNLRNVGSTAQRTAAIHLMTSAIDFIKAHYQPYATGRPANYAATFNWSVYNLPMTCIGSSIPTSPLLGNWLATHAASITGGSNPLAGLCLEVSCSAGQCTITVQWDDARGSAGSNTQQLVESFRLAP